MTQQQHQSSSSSYQHGGGDSMRRLGDRVETILISSSSSNSPHQQQEQDQQSTLRLLHVLNQYVRESCKNKVMIFTVATVGMVVLLFTTNHSNSNGSNLQTLLKGNAEDASLLWGSSSSSKKSHSRIHQKSDSDILDHNDNDDSSMNTPMPYGVNFGSWLSLEDYFYVGETGAVEVATPDANTAAVCLPPLHLGQEGAPAWQSETDLLTSMLQTTTTAKALKVFQAHRVTFITEHDLERLAKLGIQHVRVPLSWCFTDHDPDVEIAALDNNKKTNNNKSNNHNNDDAILLEHFTCPDPFFQDEGVVWPAIPRTLLARFLRLCAKYSIKASLDLHTYPGATSPGTFSGLWPKQPRFWKHDNPTDKENDVGRRLYRDFVAWVEQLDTEALDGISGISPMNEPAHLAGVFANVPSRNYLPPLPEDVAQAFLYQLNHHSTYQMPDGPHLRVFLWLSDAIQVFRESKLPQLGKQMQVNLHESVLKEDVVKETYNDDNDDDDDNNDETKASMASHKLLAAWWNKTTTPAERHDWAILDIHHYHAWSSECSGATDGPPSGNYSCGDVERRNAALQRCTEWAPKVFRAAVDEMCGKGAKLMSGEFSTSTHHRVRHACNDIDTLKTSYLMQMNAAQEADVDMYYWSYKMPHGGAFRAAWSFTELMYMLGVTDRPDHENLGCGEHIHHAGEVTDDFFASDQQGGDCLSCT